MAFETTNDVRKQTNGASHPEDLEARLEHTRTEIDDTLAALERKLSPGELLDETLDYLSHHGPGEVITQLARELKERPLPAALSAVGAAWMTKQSASLAVALARKPLPTALPPPRPSPPRWRPRRSPSPRSPASGTCAPCRKLATPRRPLTS